MQRKPISKIPQGGKKNPPESKKPKAAPVAKKLPPKQEISPGTVTKDWKELEKNVLICPGFFSQAHKKYRGHNQQSAPVCIVACAFAGLRPMNTWTREVLDHILEVGSQLYQKSRQISNNRCLDFIKTSDVYKYFFLGDLKISMRLAVETLHERILRDSTIFQKMEDFLNRFFRSHTSGVFECQHTYFAIWKFNKYFYIFDPTEHDLDGGKWTKLPGMGFCYCIRSTTPKTLADVILKNCPLRQINKFSIYPCNVEKTIKVNTVPPESLKDLEPVPQPIETPLVVKKSLLVPPKKVSLAAKAEAPPAETVPEGTEAPEADVQPKKSVSKLLAPLERPKLKSVTNFVELQTGRGILRASTHQRDPNFTKYMGAQSLANAIAALTMLRQYKSKQWIKNIVDDVLKLGEAIHHDSKTLGQECPKKVTLNEVDYSPKVEKYGVIGRLESSDDKILNLEQAIKNTLIDTDCCIIVGPNIIAIWKEDDKYYMFDPEERDASGKIVEPGKPGVACVTWYLKPADLVATYISNVPKGLRRERFMLCKVTIKDYEPVAEDWHNFKALTFNKWILRGNFSQQDRRFPPESRNAQCTANATMSLVYKELKEEKDWNSETVDQVLINGDEFYRGCVAYLEECGKFKHKYLMVDELKRNFEVENKRVNLEIDDCLVNGIINAKSDTGIPNLRKGFEEFFTESDAGIVTANLQSMAIWRRNDTYYYYDSHSRNEKGVVAGFGTACILRMVTIDDLTNALTINLGPDRENFYNISRVMVKLIDLTEEGVVIPPLNLYEALNDLVAILRSSTSQKDKKFNISAGKQTVPMCLAALAFNSVTPSFEWTKQDVDQIITFGDKLYVESMAANYGEDLPEEINVDDISTGNVKKQVKIGSNLLDLEFEDVSSGVLENFKDAMDMLSQKAEAGGNDAFQSILESEYVTASMWRDDNLFYLFDPRPRDERGQVYGKDNWSVKVEEAPVAQVESETEGEGEEKEEGEEDEEKPVTTDEDEWNEDEDKDEMGGGDNLGEPERDEDKDEDETEDADDEENVDEEEEEGEGEPVERKPSSYWREKEEEEGKACVIRFSRLDDLIQHVIDNSPPNKRGEIEFSLKSVAVSNTPVLHEIYDPEMEDKKDDFAGDWNEFKEVDYGKWILRSEKNLRDALFPVCNRGRQAIPMCIVALAFSNLYALDKYTHNVVDDILAYGDRLYTVVRKLRSKELKDNRDLGLSEDEIEQILKCTKFDVADYPRKVCIGETMAKWEATLEMIKGDVTSKIPETVHNVSSGLGAFFEENRFGILQCKDYPVAVWKRDDIFYMFDPHPSGPSGVKSPIGVACITRFKEIDHLAEIYLGNLPKIGTNMFEIHAFTFTKENCVRERHPEIKPEKETKIGGFNTVTAGKSILRGDVKLDCTKFCRGVHLHSAAIAFVALAVSLNKDPETWTRLVVNEILTVGEELYNDTIEKLGDKFDTWSDYLDICRVNPDFKIGSLKVNCAIRFNEQKGIVDVKNSKVLNLRQGLERFFEENTHGVIVAGKFILPVWEHVKGDDVSIFMFDPNSRGGTGLPGQGGVACVMKFCNAKVASDHVMACMMDIDKTKTEFAIVPVEIVVGSARTTGKGRKLPCVVRTEMTKCSKLGSTTPTLSVTMTSKTPVPRPVTTCRVPRSTLMSTKPATCPNKSALLEQKKMARKIAEQERAVREARRCATLGRNEMYVISGNQAIVRGLRSVAQDRELPVNIVAFVFMKIAADLNKWTCKQIELILEAGYQLYVDSFNAYKPDTSKITLHHVLRRVLLKDFEVKIEIKKPIIGSTFTRENLLTHLTHFFSVTNFFILCYSEFLVSIYFKRGYYYLFDPYGRDLYGNKSDNGCAMMMRFGELGELVEKVVRNLTTPDDDPQKRYALIVIGITSVEPLT